MSDVDRQQFHPVALYVVSHQLSNALGQRQLADAHFDDRFPQAGHAEQHSGVRLLDQPTGARAELRVTGDEPQERVGVEEDGHRGYMQSRKSSSGASKSS